MLEITKQEEKEMKQLISEKEAYKRHYEKVKNQNESKAQIKRERKQKLIDDMSYLRYKKLLTNKEIAEQLEVDARTVTNLIGKEPKFVTIGRMTLKEAIQYYVKLGYSNPKISNLLDISIRNIRLLKEKKE